MNDQTEVTDATTLPPRSEADLISLLEQKVIGQAAAMKFIVPYVYMWQSGLAPEGRPAGVFLLLGPTGTGKTKTVEAIAEVLHGHAKSILKIDCGEFQLDHEVAKLIGSPPGYLGHRETVPMLNQEQLDGVASENSDLSLVLFDEIEKAAPSLTRLLLGILDRATLRLGDNTTVNFEKSLIFFTSNLGAREMMKELRPGLGFQAAIQRDRSEVATKLEAAALAAVRKQFSPEFVNRIDAVVTYQPLDQAALTAILDLQLGELQRHVNTRLGARCFSLDIPPESRTFLLREGTSEEYGARELKRAIHRHVTQPLATLVTSGQVSPGAVVRCDVAVDGQTLGLKTVAPLETTEKTRPASPAVLIVDDNHQLLGFLRTELAQAGWEMLTAENAEQATRIFTERQPKMMLVDYLLGDDDGLKLGLHLQSQAPDTNVIVMTGGELSSSEEALCRQRDIPILYKPFLVSDVLRLIGYKLVRSAASS